MRGHRISSTRNARSSNKIKITKPTCPISTPTLKLKSAHGNSFDGNPALVNALAMMCPYSSAEKQALLEAPDLKTRAEILVAVTEIELAKKTTGGETPLQ